MATHGAQLNGAFAMTDFRVEVIRTDSKRYIVRITKSPARIYDTIEEAVIAVQHALMLNLSHENEQRTKDKRG